MRKVEVWPVIHVVEQGLTLRNAGLAHRLGAAGVLMISMRGRDWEARQAACDCKEAFPGLKVGANFLGLPSIDAYRMSQNQHLDATWSDRQDFYAGAVQREARATYPGLRIALPNRSEIARRIEAVSPDAIHIATEGPIGWAVRAYCRKLRPHSVLERGGQLFRGPGAPSVEIRSRRDPCSQRMFFAPTRQPRAGGAAGLQFWMIAYGHKNPRTTQSHHAERRNQKYRARNDRPPVGPRDGVPVPPSPKEVAGIARPGSCPASDGDLRTRLLLART